MDTNYIYLVPLEVPQNYYFWALTFRQNDYCSSVYSSLIVSYSSPAGFKSTVILIKKILLSDNIH